MEVSTYGIDLAIVCVCIHSINREVSVLRSYLQCVGRDDNLFQISKENLP